MAGGGGGADFEIRHLFCRIGLGLIILVSESAGELPELVQNMLVFTPESKKKKRKKKTTGTGCVFSDTRHHLIDRNSIEGKRKFIYTKKEKEKE